MPTLTDLPPELLEPILEQASSAYYRKYFGDVASTLTPVAQKITQLAFSIFGFDEQANTPFLSFFIPCFKNLTSLRSSDHKYHAGAPAVLSSSSRPDRVLHLDLHGCNAWTSEIGPALERFVHLTHLSLVHSWPLSSIARLASLQRLTFRARSVSSADPPFSDLVNLLQPFNCPSLTRLDLEDVFHPLKDIPPGEVLVLDNSYEPSREEMFDGQQEKRYLTLLELAEARGVVLGGEVGRKARGLIAGRRRCGIQLNV
ncbi:hypothetical protein JCM8547_006034 [Rhodosporidiobolus lusitaniae]